MAYHRPEGGPSFQQAQVASSSSSSSSPSFPSPRSSATRFTSCSSSSHHHHQPHHPYLSSLSSFPSPSSYFPSSSSYYHQHHHHNPNRHHHHHLPPPPLPPQRQPRVPGVPGTSTGGRGGGGRAGAAAAAPATGTSEVNAVPSSQPFVDAQFDIFEWHVQYQSCVRYFLDHAQHTGPVQAVAAFINIQLPFQKTPHPILSSKPAAAAAHHQHPHHHHSPTSSAAAAAAATGLPPPPPPLVSVTLLPYIRRLVATGFDFPAVLHGFFGDDWQAGVGRAHETERRNYLFAAKSDNWLKVKADYDLAPDQAVPFLQPLQGVDEKEIVAAEARWSEWLAMQDWMLGPRAPMAEGGGGGAAASAAGSGSGSGGVRVKREEDD